MSTDRDTTRIVRSWLEEGVTALPDRVLDTVLDQVPATPQRRSWWPARRFALVNIYSKAAIAAAAVVIVALIGYQFLPGRTSGPGGPTTAPSPSPTPAAVVTMTPAPSVPAFPPLGPLPPGTYAAVIDGVSLSFSIPGSGWARAEGLGYSIEKGEYMPPDGLAIIFWPSAPENVYSDPCAYTPLSPVPSGTAAGLAAAVAAIPGTDLVSGPSSIDVGGHPAQHVVLTIREDLGCDPEQARLWYDESSGGASDGWRWASALGATIQVWIIDVDGTLVWIDAETFAGAGPEPGAEIQAFIDSIEFE